MITLVRYCELCGRRFRISLDKLRECRTDHRKLLCGSCLAKHKLGWYTDEIVCTD